MISRILKLFRIININLSSNVTLIINCFHREKVIEKEMFKRVNDCSAYLGNMTIKLIIFCASNIP